MFGCLGRLNSRLSSQPITTLIDLPEEHPASSNQFAVRRVGHLSDQHAAQLVSRFMEVFGRPSEDHDFSQSS